MKVKYIDFYKKLVIDGEDALIILPMNSKVGVNIDSKSLNTLGKKYGIKISFEKFHVIGRKLTIKEKVKMIFRILKL